VRLLNAGILRHIYSQPFTKDCLYLDADEHIVDLTGVAQRDITGNRINSIKSFAELVASDPNNLIELIEYYVCKGWGLGPQLEIALQASNMPPQRPITDVARFTQLMNSNMQGILDFINHHRALRTYFYDYLGMQTVVTFTKL